MFYPGATLLLNGVSGGEYVGYPWRVVLHTTETRGIPGYNDGLSAPHVTYNPATGAWVQHTSFLTAARALRNEPDGVQTNRGNCIQVEIVCYSSKPTAERVGGLWVGNLNPRHLDDILSFLEWTTQLGVQLYWPGSQAFSYAEANSTGFRMSNTDWMEFNGVCGHQHVPENTHWDPGALNWSHFNFPLEPGDDMTPEQEAAVNWLILQRTAALNPAFDAAFQKAISVGMFSTSTKKDDLITAAKLAVFLDRKGLLDPVKAYLPDEEVVRLIRR